MPSERLLVVDDQADFASGLSRLIAKEFPKLECHTAGSAEDALAELDRARYAILLTDMRMPGLSGMELIPEALARDPSLSIVMLTAFGTIETAVEALKVGACDFLTKPVDRDNLIRVVQRCLERSRLLGENERLRALMAESDARRIFIGESLAMRRIKESVGAVAVSDYTVLVTGESGTGKELVARTIHKLSNRAKGPLVIVNCTAIPEQLLESELFGHVKGAFTGADRTREGLFVAARGGTLVLDEIGDIPQNVQTKLLRALQEQEIRPVGSNATVTVDARIVACTNSDLEARMAEGRFREDLFYRLNVLQIHVPSLRQRAEDIPLLARFFLAESCAELGVAPKGLTPETLAWLAACPWPGNVRELQNYMRRLAVFAQTSEIDLPLIRLIESAGPGAPPEPLSDLPYHDAKARVLDDFTRTYVHTLLERSQGNVSEAARLSGLERVSLQKILKRLDIDAGSYR